jgi:fibronectin-binding autotransporter adhesin
MLYCKSLACAILLLMAAMPAAAATLTWDADTVTVGIQDGNGTWTTGGTNWWDGSANQAWANGDSAIIGNGGISAALPLITVSGTVTLSELTFASNGQPTFGLYEIAGGTLSFNSGSAIKVNQARDSAATTGNLQRSKISSAIAGANLTITSDILSPAPPNSNTVNLTGFLDLSGTNANTGTLTLGSNATVFMTTSAALSAGVTSVAVNPTSTLDFNFAGTVTVPVTLNSLGASDGSTVGVIPTHAAPVTSNAGALRLGAGTSTQDFNSPVTFTGNSEIQAAAAAGNIVNLNAAGGNLTSAYHLTLRANQGSTLNVNRAVNVASLGLRLNQSSSSGGGTININQPVTASDLFVVPTSNTSFININAPITLNTAAGLGKMTARSTTTTIGTGAMAINATITAPGGVEFMQGLTSTRGVELNNATGFALDTPEILFTPGGAAGATLVVTKANDQISHNAVLTFMDAGNVRTFRLEGHTVAIAGLQTTGTFATASQAVIENKLAGTTGILTVDNAADYLFGGTLQNGTGTGSMLALVKKGTGKLALTGTTVAGYSGGTTVEAGTLDLSAATIANTNYKLTLTGGTVDFGSTYPSMGLFKITGGTASDTGYLTSNVNYDVQAGTVAVPLVGTTGLNKTGSGTATLSGANSYTGVTTISGGTLALTGMASIASSASIDLQNGSRLDGSALSSTFYLPSIKGDGFIKGNASDTYGTALAPGHATTVGTLTFENNLTLNAGSSLLNLDLSSSVATGSDKIVVQGNLDLGYYNNLTINVGALGASVQTATPYTVLSYTGSLNLNGGPAPTFTVNENTRYSFTAALDQVGKKITVTAAGGPAKNLTWAAATSPSDWDLIASFNWKEGAAAQQFYDLDTVAFGEGFAGTVNLTAAVRPGAINVNATQDYEFTGTGYISGGPTFVKSGSGTLTISTANNFVSDLTVNSGTLKINNAAALGTTEGKTHLANTGILDVNGFSIGDEEVVVDSGSNAKIGNTVDNVAITQDAIRFLTLNGDVTLGGLYFWDMRNRVNIGVGTYLAGNGRKITKVDSNVVGLVDLGETNLGDVDIQQGQLSFVRTTTMGNPTGTVSVAGGAILRIYGSFLNYNKKVNLADAAILDLDHSSNATISGVVTLTGGMATIDLAGGTPTVADTLTLSGDVTGSGGFTLTGHVSSKLILNGAKSYTGNTLISSATLSLTGSGTIGSTLITVNTTLNAVNGDHTLNAIDGTGTVNVAAGASLTAASINVNALNIGGTPAAAVPEPAAWFMLLMAAIMVVWHRHPFRKKL